MSDEEGLSRPRLGRMARGTTDERPQGDADRSAPIHAGSARAEPLRTGCGGPGPGCPESECAAPVPRHDARALTAGGNTVHICLDGIAYTLRITRNGKLILTK